MGNAVIPAYTKHTLITFTKNFYYSRAKMD